MQTLYHTNITHCACVKIAEDTVSPEVLGIDVEAAPHYGRGVVVIEV